MSVSQEARKGGKFRKYVRRESGQEREGETGKEKEKKEEKEREKERDEETEEVATARKRSSSRPEEKEEAQDGKLSPVKTFDFSHHTPTL